MSLLFSFFPLRLSPSFLPHHCLNCITKFSHHWVCVSLLCPLTLTETTNYHPSEHRFNPMLFNVTWWLCLVDTSDERDAIQKKSFTKWVNRHLVKASKRVIDLFEDLKDGGNLISLLEVLSGEHLVSNTFVSMCVFAFTWKHFYLWRFVCGACVCMSMVSLTKKTVLECHFEYFISCCAWIVLGWLLLNVCMCASSCQL